MAPLEEQFWRRAWDFCPQNTFHGFDGRNFNGIKQQCSQCQSMVTEFQKCYDLGMQEAEVKFKKEWAASSKQALDRWFEEGRWEGEGGAQEPL